MEYQLTFQNPTAIALQDVQISDATPAFTALSGITPVFVVTEPNGVSGLLSCTGSAQGDGYIGDISWSCPGGMAPGARGVVGFRVQIAN